jgi:hypothetical protein
MDQCAFDEEISFAAHKLGCAQEALSNQIVIIYRLKMLGLDPDFAGRDLDEVSTEYRRWQEYCTLLLIRRSMARDVFEAAHSFSANAKPFGGINCRGAREFECGRRTRTTHSGA